MTSKSIPAPPALVSPINQMRHIMRLIRETSELPSTARLLNDDLLFYAAISCSFVFWRAIQQRKASQISCFVLERCFTKPSWLICRNRCYQVLSASCKLLGVDNRSACHRTGNRDYSIKFFLQTFFSGVLWSEVIHNPINSFIIYYSGRTQLNNINKTEELKTQLRPDKSHPGSEAK